MNEDQPSYGATFLAALIGSGVFLFTVYLAIEDCSLEPTGLTWADLHQYLFECPGPLLSPPTRNTPPASASQPLEPPSARPNSRPIEPPYAGVDAHHDSPQLRGLASQSRWDSARSQDSSQPPVNIQSRRRTQKPSAMIPADLSIQTSSQSDVSRGLLAQEPAIGRRNPAAPWPRPFAETFAEKVQGPLGEIRLGEIRLFDHHQIGDDGLAGEDNERQRDQANATSEGLALAPSESQNHEVISVNAVLTAETTADDGLVSPLTGEVPSPNSAVSPLDEEPESHLALAPRSQQTHPSDHVLPDRSAASDVGGNSGKQSPHMFGLGQPSQRTHLLNQLPDEANDTSSYMMRPEERANFQLAIGGTYPLSERRAPLEHHELQNGRNLVPTNSARPSQQIKCTNCRISTSQSIQSHPERAETTVYNTVATNHTAATSQSSRQAPLTDLLFRDSSSVDSWLDIRHHVVQTPRPQFASRSPYIDRVVIGDIPARRRRRSRRRALNSGCASQEDES